MWMCAGQSQDLPSYAPRAYKVARTVQYWNTKVSVTTRLRQDMREDIAEQAFALGFALEGSFVSAWDRRRLKA